MHEPPSTRLTLIRRLVNPEDNAAWETFIDQYAPLLYRYARTKGLQDADAADLVQEVFESVSRHVERFEPRFRKRSFRRWFFRIAYSKFCDLVQRRRRQPKAYGDMTEREEDVLAEGLDESSLWEIERRKEVFEAAAREIRPMFQESTWKAFWATAVEGKNPQSVADSLQLSIGAVYIAKSRVMAKLKQRVRELEQSGERGV